VRGVVVFQSVVAVPVCVSVGVTAAKTSRVGRHNERETSLVLDAASWGRSTSTSTSTSRILVLTLALTLTLHRLCCSVRTSM